MNKQQLYFIKTLFRDNKNKDTINISVRDKAGAKFEIQVYPNRKKQPLPYRLILSNNVATNWSDWETFHDAKKYFKMWGLL